MEILSLQPEAVWERFAAFCAVPHPSHHEEAIGKAVLSWAKEHGIASKIDAAGNVALYQAASAGKEKAPAVILQAHLDMVPQKAATSAHDFEKDPIRPRLDPADHDWVIATDTTLGADNGIGVAMAMALMIDPERSSGPLSCLFTINEEDGMSGARAIEPGFVSGNILLNLDNEDIEELTIGCAGAIRSKALLSRTADTCPKGLTWFQADIGGLLGGHSGVDIDKGRANATLALAGLLAESRKPLYMASLSGGTAANAIPRDASALVGLSSNHADAFKAAFAKAASALGVALGNKDPGLKATLSLSDDQPVLALGPEGSASLLQMLGTLPNGLRAMEPDMPGLIRTSLNLGQLVAKIQGADFIVDTMVMIRSSSDEEKSELAAIVEARLDEASRQGWSVKRSRPAESPAWSPNNASPLLAKAKDVYKELFGHYPKVASTHGGLEPGLFRPRFPEWDMVSFGPTIRFPHSPDERVNVASVESSYRFLKRLVASL